MRLIHYTFAVAALLICGIAAYTVIAPRTGSGTPPDPAPADSMADRILVAKADRKIYLFRDGQPVKTYRISMGPNWNSGHKQKEGDKRTPEGSYVIDWRNPDSVAHLSLHISYPNSADEEAALQAGYSPGGNIMIHGLPNGWGALGVLHHLVDWTSGCIAVTNAEMQEIWSLVPDGTPVEIIAGSMNGS